MNGYHHPEGWSGVGSDIGWCGRERGGKRCQLCKHHATFDVWSKAWHFYYLTSYCYDACYNYWRAHIHYNWRTPHSYNTTPVKYNIRGLSYGEQLSLKTQGCKPKRKCKCISIVQRGHWYCPGCWVAINKLAQTRAEHPHDTMLIPRQDLKHDWLLLKLSGIL
jgi:hypothetical protein